MAEVRTAAVSVVIPCYRCAATIERAVASVAAQTLRPAEVFLVEDCSDDSTLEALYSVQRRYPEGWVHVIEQLANRGPGEARNAGWERARQPYIAFLDADDSWHPRKIEIQYQWMCEHPDVALTGHATRQSNEGEDPVGAPRFGSLTAEFHFVTKNRLLWSNLFSTRSVMLRRDLPVRFAAKKYHSEDYLLWLTIACDGQRMARCDHQLAFSYKAPYGEGGLSSELWKMQKGQLDTYRRIWRMGCVGTLSFLCVVVWSWLRFFRRTLMVLSGPPH